jgi:uncharacterized membrane protein YphA (DoxX/SURF4 family)
MTSMLQGLIGWIGRILLSLIFVASAAGKIVDFPGTMEQMRGEGMRLVPFFLVMAIGFELIGGLSVMLGVKARWGALLLIAFLIPATVIFHDFWQYTGADAQKQMFHFMKNLSILGGLTLVLAHGAGPWTVDSRRAKRDKAKG